MKRFAQHSSRHSMSRSMRRRLGSSVIVLLIVVGVILLLMLMGPFHTDPVTQVTEAQNNIERSRVSVCMANRRTAEGYLLQQQAMNGQLPSVEKMRREIRDLCPGNGAYFVSEDGKVYCSEHSEGIPITQLQQMIQLSEPEPVHTPPPAPKATPFN